VVVGNGNPYRAHVWFFLDTEWGSPRYHFRLYDGDVDGDLVIGLGNVLFKVNASLQDFHPALNIFKSQSEGAFIHFLEIILSDTSSIMMKPKIEPTFLHILCDVHETGVGVFEDVVDQFLHDPEDEQFLFRNESLAVIMEPAAGVDGAGATYVFLQLFDRCLL
jgi:hypothetical protein